MSLQRQRIMVVDDEPDILESLERFLKKWELDIDAFLDPVLALKQFEERPKDYEMVISDIRMPGLDGLELVKTILQLRPDVKLIFITAFFTEEIEIEKAMPRRDYEVFEKPFSLKKLCERITQLLKENS